MKAWVLHGINDLRFEDLTTPNVKDGEVLVKVKRAGICSSDVQRVFVSGAYHYPIVLGHEFSGVTEDGRRVGVFPLIPCFECESCKAGYYEVCSNYGYIGSRQDGAFAEYAAVPEWNLVDLPGSITFEQAALLEPAAVALHAVRRLDLSGILSAAVIGNGAIGQLIAKWLAIYGVAEIDLLGRGTNGNIACYDLCVEAAGSADTLRRCIDLVKPNGQILLVGNPNVDFNVEQKLYWQILRKQLIVRGSWNSSYPSDWQCVLDNAKKLKLDEFISHRYKFNDLDKAFEMMRCKLEKHIKVIAVFE